MIAVCGKSDHTNTSLAICIATQDACKPTASREVLRLDEWGLKGCGIGAYKEKRFSARKMFCGAFVRSGRWFYEAILCLHTIDVPGPRDISGAVGRRNMEYGDQL